MPAPLRQPVVERDTDRRVGAVLQSCRWIRRSARRCGERRVAGEMGFTADAFEPRGMERAPNLWTFFFNQ